MLDNNPTLFILVFINIGDKTEIPMKKQSVLLGHKERKMSEIKNDKVMSTSTQELLDMLKNVEIETVRVVETRKPRKESLPREFVRLQALLNSKQVKTVEINDGAVFSYITRTGFLLFETELFPSDTLISEVAPYFADNTKLRFVSLGEENKYQIFFEKDGSEEVAVFQIKTNARQKKATAKPEIESEEDTAQEMPEL